jgi:hypothetical protein
MNTCVSERDSTVAAATLNGYAATLEMVGKGNIFMFCK